MMKPLRRRHLRVWKLLAVALPAGIILAWLSVPKQLPQHLLQPETVQGWPIVLKTVEKDNYTVSIRSKNPGSSLQLEWINKMALQYPTATVYAGRDFEHFEKNRLIGRIESRGNWYFTLDSLFSPGTGDYLILYDFIHQQVIDTIDFTK